MLYMYNGNFLSVQCMQVFVNSRIKLETDFQNYGQCLFPHLQYPINDNSGWLVNISPIPYYPLRNVVAFLICIFLHWYNQHTLLLAIIKIVSQFKLFFLFLTSSETQVLLHSFINPWVISPQNSHFDWFHYRHTTEVLTNQVWANNWHFGIYNISEHLR